MLSVLRALICWTPIVVVDQISDECDPRVSQVICKMVCEKFTTSTVIIVSLDVETIIECDRIMVMEAGRIVELHEPHALLQSSKSVLNQFVEDKGPKMAESLRHKAAELHRRRQSAPRNRHTSDALRRPDSDQDVLAWSMRRLSASNALTHGQSNAPSPKPISPN